MIHFKMVQINMVLQVKITTRKMPRMMGEKHHHNLIGDSQKGFRHQKIKVTKGGVAKS